ncbi:G-protein coupled receptor protein [Moelleriella libera RCEF 2490]|uniref:G-protein coupled receptor protein n=1 Tax=Moelleriella libera RCEF 2490 TaxID=1081109 RepID=A0A166U8E5_9HYPO|nr:G-protein coupled receptor protein [Moelleriella libera RCEF 2490]
MQDPASPSGGGSGGGSFTDDQLDMLVTLERVGGSISLVSVLLVFLAFALVRRVRNVQNTFIVFASVSNVGASVASIVALDGLAAGKRSPLCQAQGFMFQMFMQSDPWWSLAMAINVLLVFYFRASPNSFQRWWWLYCIICYGGPLMIALILLVVKDTGKGPVYGDATIWCWVDSNWDGIRIYTYYLLIWICIAGSMLCYMLVGCYVFRSRNRLHSFSVTNSHERHGRGLTLLVKTRHEGSQDDRPSPPPPPLPHHAFYGTVTTEVQITSSAIADMMCPDRGALHDDSPAALSVSPTAQYFSCVSAAPLPLLPLPPPPSPQQPPPTQQVKPSRTGGSSSSSSSSRSRSRVGHAIGSWVKSLSCAIARATGALSSKFVVHDAVKRAYLRTSLLFAMSVLVTWTPSSLNRIHSWLAGQSPYEFHVATAAVLPLQGLWNAIIFFMTSWTAVRDRMAEIVGEKQHQQQPAEERPAQPHREPTATTRGGAGGGGAPLRADGDGDSLTLHSDIELKRVERLDTKEGCVRSRAL